MCYLYDTLRVCLLFIVCTKNEGTSGMGYVTKKSKSFIVPPKMYSCAGQGAQFIKLPLYTKHRANVDSCFPLKCR